jgi:hypothetical protein
LPDHQKPVLLLFDIKENGHMKRLLLIAALLCSPMALADSGGTATEARAMLTKTVAAVKADPLRAFFTINNGDMADRDLYPFCFRLSDGKFVAVGDRTMEKVFLGIDIRTISTEGRMFGLDIYHGAKAGGVSEVSYHFFRPGFHGLAPETTFVTAVGNFGCGVGYYTPPGTAT